MRFSFSCGKILSYIEMAFAPPRNLDGPKMQTKMSTWTPLNHQLLNEKIFEERRILLGKWVSWHWKNLAELDQLWMRKCLRFNWCISFSPTPFEQGVWKKHYIEMVKELHITKPKTPPKNDFMAADVRTASGDPTELKQSPSSALHSSCSFRKKSNRGEKDLPPWRSSDKHPTDIIRFNYLDNCDPIEQAWQVKKKGNEQASDFSRQSHNKKNKFQDRSKLRKAQSLVSLEADCSSPLKVPSHHNWASHESLRCTKAKAQMVTHHFQEHHRTLFSPIQASELKLN
ncbi:F-box only protein 16 isoform X3 [Notamacropus eugenii]|uniref:F-box only protein 16 isoform X3 n=1 Tax=Notamacropus eugenii TaxID=9315 RepID=UPI003B673A3E